MKTKSDQQTSKVLLALLAGLGMSGLTATAQVDIPPSAAVAPARNYPGNGLNGEYWKRPPVSILTDGRSNRENGIDRQIRTFGDPTGRFKATQFVYSGNDLTTVTTWLGSDASSFVGTADNLDDGAFRFTGFLNVTAPGTIRLGLTSDDGSRITINGIDVAERDGSHGDETQDVDVNFAAAGLYPIEITYFNGDWTSDGNNHSGNPDPSVHGGANFRLRLNEANITPAGVQMLHMQAPLPQATIGLNFGADDNGQALGLAPGDVAGVVPQGNWNNLNGANGSAA
ncbi:MAG TPA: PA14 domain-containing protein, partial [Methylomirabilota bacterium]|nr:PA14 domain-containing protein [Methylomirabilota bacterium]